MIDKTLLNTLILNAIPQWREPFLNLIPIKVVKPSSQYKYELVTNALNDSGEQQYLTYTCNMQEYAYSTTIPNADNDSTKLESVVSELVKRAESDIGRMIYGNRDGIIATASKVVADGLYITDRKYFYIGQKISFQNNGNTIVATVDYLPLDNNFVGFSTAQTVAETESQIAVRNANRAVELTGLTSFKLNTFDIYGIDLRTIKWCYNYMWNKEQTAKGTINPYEIAHLTDSLRDEYHRNKTFALIPSELWVDLDKVINDNHYTTMPTEERFQDYIRRIGKVQILPSVNALTGKLCLIDKSDFVFLQDGEWKPYVDYVGDKATITISKHCELVAIKPYKIKWLTGIQTLDSVVTV